jgi:hypothetical protein
MILLHPVLQIEQRMRKANQIYYSRNPQYCALWPFYGAKEYDVFYKLVYAYDHHSNEML